MTITPLQRILYVEDDPYISTVAEMALEMVGGFTLCTCDSGHAAIKAAPEFNPDLLLLDVMMPGMDGPTTLANLRQLPGTANTPVIFMTARVLTHETKHYHSLGAIGVISKPFDPMLLAEQVRSLYAQQAN